jgi:2-oxo-4-hydroxy-4-carboxy-5-ureidoimidazoline decarboxylase
MLKFDDIHYGEGCVKIAKVLKNDLKEYIIDIQLYGGFLESDERLCNEKMIPKETLKKCIFFLAQQHPMNNPVEFGIDATNYFLENFLHVSKVSMDITEVLWSRIKVNNFEHTHGFVDKQTHQNKCLVINKKDEVEVRAGIENFHVLKTRRSSTTEVPFDRCLMATLINIYWKYDNVFDLKSIDHNEIYKKIKEISIETFVSRNDNESILQAINLLGKNVLSSITEIKKVEVNLSESNYLLSNMNGLLENNVYEPATEPYTNISANISKTDYTIDLFNRLPREDAIHLLKDVCASKSFQHLMVDSRPFNNVDDLIGKLDCIYERMNKQDFLDAINSHSRLGDNVKNKKLTWIKEEISDIFESKLCIDEQIEELVNCNNEYEAKFNHIFLLSVTGKNLDAIIMSIKSRIKNDAEIEFNICVNEMKKIVMLRIPRVLKSFGQKKLTGTMVC